MILCSNPKFQYEAKKEAIDQAISGVLESGQYVFGQQVADFEAEFAQFLSAREAVGVANGTDALYLALRACDIGPGDEVITVSHTAVATISAIEMTGAIPVLVDIDPHFFHIDPAKIDQAVTKKTKAIIAVHLYGQPVDIDSILQITQKHQLRLIEDCAQSCGAKYEEKYTGTFGDAAAFSFYPTKNLGAIGDGGAVVTNDKTIAKKVRLLREYGWDEQRQCQVKGINSRLDEIQAAVLRVKLKDLENDNQRRQEVAKKYQSMLQETFLELPAKRKGCTHVYHLYVVRNQMRDGLRKDLAGKDIYAGIHYPVPVHLQPAYKDNIKVSGSLEETVKAANEVLSLPMYPELKDEEIHLIIKQLKQIMEMSLYSSK